MHGTTVSNRRIHRVTEHAILKEVTILNRFGDTREVLVDRAACANIHMSNFRVAHLTIGQAYGHA